MTDRKEGRPRSMLEILTAPTSDLPEGDIPLIYQPTEAEQYLQREIVQMADYLRQQRERRP